MVHIGSKPVFNPPFSHYSHRNNRNKLPYQLSHRISTSIVYCSILTVNKFSLWKYISVLFIKQLVHMLCTNRFLSLFRKYI